MAEASFAVGGLDQKQWNSCGIASLAAALQALLRDKYCLNVDASDMAKIMLSRSFTWNGQLIADAGTTLPNLVRQFNLAAKNGLVLPTPASDHLVRFSITYQVHSTISSMKSGIKYGCILAMEEGGEVGHFMRTVMVAEDEESVMCLNSWGTKEHSPWIPGDLQGARHEFHVGYTFGLENVQCKLNSDSNWETVSPGVHKPGFLPWTMLGGCDFFQGQHADFTMSASNLDGVKKVAIQRGFTAFTVWEGIAFFKPWSVEECRANLFFTDDVTAYLLEKPRPKQWKKIVGKDCFRGEHDALILPATSPREIDAAMEMCLAKGFTVFTVWEGNAYFKPWSSERCRADLYNFDEEITVYFFETI